MGIGQFFKKVSSGAKKVFSKVSEGTQDFFKKGGILEDGLKTAAGQVAGGLSQVSDNLGSGLVSASKLIGAISNSPWGAPLSPVLKLAAPALGLVGNVAQLAGSGSNALEKKIIPRIGTGPAFI